MRASLHARLLRRSRARARGFPARTEIGMTLVELMVAISILAIVMSGLALSIGVDYKAVALARSRQVAESVANQRLEELRDVDYDTMALSSAARRTAPTTTNPDYCTSTTGPATTYDVTGTGQNEALIIDSPDGPVDHIESPVTVGTTVVDVYQYVTWVDDPGIAGTQNLKRLTVVVQYHSVPTIGQARMLRESVVLTPGNVTLGVEHGDLDPGVVQLRRGVEPGVHDQLHRHVHRQRRPAGSGTSTATAPSTAPLQNPTYTFAGAGDYPVSLTVTKGSLSGSVTNTVTVTTATTTTTTATHVRQLLDRRQQRRVGRVHGERDGDDHDVARQLRRQHLRQLLQRRRHDVGRRLRLLVDRHDARVDRDERQRHQDHLGTRAQRRGRHAVVASGAVDHPRHDRRRPPRRRSAGPCPARAARAP